MKYRLIFFVALINFLLINTLSFSRDPSVIRRSGKIYVGMTIDDRKNINYQLAVEFAKYLNVELVIVDMDWEEAFMKDGKVPPEIETDPLISYTPDIFKKVDIICSTFTVLDWRKKLFDFAETLNSAELLVIDKDSGAVSDFSMLKGRTIAFMEGTSFESNLKAINKENNNLINLEPTKTGSESKDLFQAGKVFGIILDADEALNFIKLNDMKYTIALSISPVTKTAWAVEKGNSLKREVTDFFRTIENNGVLNQVFNSEFSVSYTSYLEKISKNKRSIRYKRDLDEILSSGKLIVAFRDRSLVYKEGGEKQPMHALAEEFADYLGVSLEYVITPSLNKYWETADGRFVRDSAYTPDWFNYFDVACEIFSVLEWRSKKIDFVPVYPTEYSVIARKDLKIKSVDDLRKLKCVTTKGSAYVDLLTKNKLGNFYYESANNLLHEVASGKADYTIMDNVFSELPEYPDLEAKISLGSVNICWGLRKDQPKLEAELNKFMTQSQKNGLINTLTKAMQRKNLQSPEAFVNAYYEGVQPGQLPYVLYGSNDGLPQEEIFSIFQDSKGYMWFGTSSGAVRYNGREMKSVKPNPEHGDNSVKDIDQDSVGTIFMATSKGVALFNNDTISNRIFTNTGFHSIFIDKSDNKWFIGDDGVYFLNKSGSQHHLNQDFPNLPVSVYSIDEDPKTGDKFISTANGIYLFSSKLNQVSQLTKEECYSAFVDKNDSIWFSTRQGLLISAIPEIKKNGMSGKFRNLNSTLNVQNEIINNISTNKYGSVWLVTDSRIIQAISTDQEAIQYEQKKGIKDNKIMSFLIDKEDNIWVGFSGGLQRLSKYKGLRNFYPNTINSFIYSFYADNSDRLWIASNNGVFYYEEELINFTPRLGSDNLKYVMGKLANGNLLFANSKGLYEVDKHSLSIVQESRFKEMIMSPEGVFISSKGEIVILTGFNGILYYLSGFNSDPLVIKNKWSSNVTRLIEKDGRIIGGSSNGLIELKNGSLKSLAEMDCQVYSVYNDKGILWLGTDFGLAYIKNSDFDNIHFVSVGNSTVVKSIFPAKNRNYLWLGTNQGISYFNKTYFESDYFIDSKDGLSADEITPAGLFLDRNGLLWIGTFHGISNFNMRAKSTISYTPECYIERTLLNGRKIDNTDGHSFRYNQNNLIFEISALTYKSKESIEYEFYLRGTGNDYSSYHKGKEFKAYYNNLPPGTYEFIYKAKGDNNIWGYAKKYEFNIKTAWYNTVVFRSLLIIAIALLIWLFYKQRVKSIEAQKRKLEEIVRIRTNELQLANLEIEGQRDLATAQRDKIIEQKKEITDSIYYSERIQRSLLPESGALKKILPEHFILFKPRDIVSGDFYWVTEKANFTYVAAVDCTGHGVPGALMSMLGISFLNEIVNKSGDMYPEEILNQLRNYIIKALKQAGQIGEARDGMDASLIAYDKSNGLISFSGANNPLYLVRNGELEEIKGDKMPVGIHERMDSFTRHTFNVKSGDAIYLFSDGYADQFGGPKYKKFKYANFKTLLVSLQPLPMETQCCKLQETMNEWKGDKEQIDDMIIVGLRF